MNKVIKQALIYFVGAATTSISTLTTAQSIIPANDGTGTRVQEQRGLVNITGGSLSRDGANLFHSFQQFNVSPNQSANFVSNPNIQNILSRVTGGSPSLINGLIQVTGGNSNLYLINPAGIVFGNNASLNIPAAFTATTANQIGFGNGNFLYSAFTNNYQNLTGTPNQFIFDNLLTNNLRTGRIVNPGNLTISSGQNFTFRRGETTNTVTLVNWGENTTLIAVPGTNLVRISQPGNILTLEITPPENGIITPAILPELLTGSLNTPRVTLTQNEINIPLIQPTTPIPVPSPIPLPTPIRDPGAELGNAQLSPSVPNPPAPPIRDPGAELGNGRLVPELPTIVSPIRNPGAELGNGRPIPAPGIELRSNLLLSLDTTLLRETERRYRQETQALLSNETDAQKLFREGERLRRRGTRESLEQAFTKFQQALVLFRTTSSNLIAQRLTQRKGEADALNGIGEVYAAIGQPQQSLDFHQQALLISREIQHRQGEAAALNNLGERYRDLGELQRALDLFQQALLIRREIKDRTEEAETLDNIGGVYAGTGQLQRALDFYQQALSTSREVTDLTEERLRRRTQEATTLNNIGETYRIIGQPQQALNFYQQALPMRREVEDLLGEATTLTSIGTVYFGIGQLQQALNFYQQALLISQKVGYPGSEAGILNNIGLIYANVGQSQQALDFYQRSLEINRKVAYRAGEATVLNNIGAVYRTIRQLPQALDFYQQSLVITREVGDRAGEATTLTSIGVVYRNMAEPQQALNFHQQALLVTREVGDRAQEVAILGNLALTQQDLSNLSVSLENIQMAIAIVEDIRSQLINPELRTSYFASVQDYYKLQIDLLMQLHTSATLSNLQQNSNQSYAAQAFNVTERSKARTLLELLTESKADIRNGVDPQLLQQERELQSQLAALDKRRLELGNSITNDNKDQIAAQIAALEKQREPLQTQYQNLQSQIRQTSPKYAALKYPQPLTLEQIQQQILDDNTLILSYSLGQDKSYLWLISKTEMTSYELPSQKTIEDLVNKNARSQFTSRLTSRNSFILDTSEVSNILLKPVLDKLGNKRLAIIGDGVLQYVPFGALPDPRAGNNQYQPLLVNNEVVYLPSASTLQTIRNETQNRPTPPKTLAVIADPVFATDDLRVGSGSRSAPNPAELPFAAQNLEIAARGARGGWDRLPGTRQEADTILNLVPENSRLAYFDFQANRANAQNNQLSQYRLIHWATHGFANTQKAELSGIVMSLVNETGQQQNGYLLLGDIFNLSFNADLVVLSACETGRGEVIQGEGLIGLTRGLMYAGTPRVVASLWAVPDAETATLMGKFYEKMLQQNLRPAEALRAAQLEMFRSRPWMAPYFWAAFTLQGEWH